MHVATYKIKTAGAGLTCEFVIQANRFHVFYTNCVSSVTLVQFELLP